MRLIVTGGAGFIGSHLVEKLIQNGHKVIVLDNLFTGRLENLKNVEGNAAFSFFNVDISRLDDILKYFKGVDQVFHLAALADIVPSIVEPYKYHKANIEGTIAVLEASRLGGVAKFIYTASSSCYGIPKVCPTPEEAEISPQYPYAFTKYIGERCSLFWAKLYKIEVTSLRLFNVYGPRSRTSGTYGAVLGVFLAQKLAGLPFTIVGDGTQKRDFVHVSDVVEAFVKASGSGLNYEIFNVGSGNPQTINRLASLLKGKKVHIAKRPGEPDCTWADITRIKDGLGWQPRVSFEKGIQNLLSQINYWKDAPVWTPEKIEEATKDWFKCLSR